jgi:pantothenate synthetase
LPSALRNVISKWIDGVSATKDLIDYVNTDLSKDPAIDVQYISVVHNGTMRPVEVASEHDVIIAAIVVDGIRLIDNMTLTSA